MFKTSVCWYSASGKIAKKRVHSQLGTTVSFISSHRTYQNLCCSLFPTHTWEKDHSFFFLTKKTFKDPKNLPKNQTLYWLNTRKDYGNSPDLSNFLGHLFRRTITANLLPDGPDSRNLPLGGCVDTFTSLVVFPGLAVNSDCLVKTLFLLDYLGNCCVGSIFILLSSSPVLIISQEWMWFFFREKKKVMCMYVIKTHLLSLH